LTSSKKGVSSVQLAEQLQVTQKTAWFLNHRIREMFKETAPLMLTGIVEADETWVGGKNKNRHASKRKDGGADKTPVVGLLERGGKVLTFVVPSTGQDILHPLMVDHVAKESTLITDHWNGYFGLESHCIHVKVKGETAYGNYKTDRHFHTNNIENFWSTFKRGIIGIYHSVSTKHLHRYTTEFGYRYNNREDSGVIKFQLAVGKSGKKRLNYEKLIGRKTSQTMNGIAGKETNNPMPPDTDPLDLINPDESPIIE
jgi:transposase-like protein